MQNTPPSLPPPKSARNPSRVRAFSTRNTVCSASADTNSQRVLPLSFHPVSSTYLTFDPAAALTSRRYGASSERLSSFSRAHTLPRAIGHPSTSPTISAVARLEPLSDAPSSATAAPSLGPVQLAATSCGIVPRVTRPQRPHRHAKERCSLITTATGGNSAT